MPCGLAGRLVGKALSAPYRLRTPTSYHAAGCSLSDQPSGQCICQAGVLQLSPVRGQFSKACRPWAERPAAGLTCGISIQATDKPARISNCRAQRGRRSRGFLLANQGSTKGWQDLTRHRSQTG